MYTIGKDAGIFRMPSKASLAVTAADVGACLQIRSRHDRTMIVVKEAIARYLATQARTRRRLMEVGGAEGWQTVYFQHQLAEPQRAAIVDWRDSRLDAVKPLTDFFQVDIETDPIPVADGSYDVIVCNQVLEHLKNIDFPITEIHRVLRPGGVLIVSVPNLGALHNVLLLALGRQPSTLALQGSHVRGFTMEAMTRYLTFNEHFRLRHLWGFGLHPFTSSAIPPPLRRYCHTPLWILEKNISDRPTWVDYRAGVATTTKF